ncbi:TPA: hypothetical protein ACH3X3_012783 [Trebouxia sp. C0006]
MSRQQQRDESHSDFARHLVVDLQTAFRLLPNVDAFIEDQEFSSAVEAKKAMYSHLVNQCNGQTNRSFPCKSADQPVEAYESELKAWLHEKASYKVHKIHKKRIEPSEQVDPMQTPSAADSMQKKHREESNVRCRDVNLIDPKDVQYLCTKLQKLYAFSEREIQQVPDLLENCQRHPKEFLLRLKSKAQQRSKQHRTVKDFAPQLRARIAEGAAAVNRSPGVVPAASRQTQAEAVAVESGPMHDTPTRQQVGNSPEDTSAVGSPTSSVQKRATGADKVGGAKRSSASLEGDTSRGAAKKQKSTQQVVDEQVEAMVASVLEGLDQIKDAQRAVAPLDDRASASLRQEIAKCQAGIQHLESISLSPDLIEPIRAELIQLQEQEAALFEKERGDMRRAAACFQQALHAKLRSKYGYLLDVL